MLTARDVYHLSWSRLGANFSWSWFQISFKKKNDLTVSANCSVVYLWDTLFLCRSCWVFFFSEPHWKRSLAAVDFTGRLNAAASWECPWSWKSFWEIPTSRQGQFPDLFYLHSLWSCVTTLPQQRICKRNTGVQFARVKVIFCQLLSIKQRRCLEQVGSGRPRCRVLWWLGRMQQISCLYVSVNEFQDCSCVWEWRDVNCALKLCVNPHVLVF